MEETTMPQFSPNQGDSYVNMDISDDKETIRLRKLEYALIASVVIFQIKYLPVGVAEDLFAFIFLFVHLAIK
ncbi:unnamed protein product [Rhizopus stolonifer]